jgi:hypothetical protein
MHKVLNKNYLSMPLYVWLYGIIASILFVGLGVFTAVMHYFQIPIGVRILIALYIVLPLSVMSFITLLLLKNPAKAWVNANTLKRSIPGFDRWDNLLISIPVSMMLLGSFLSTTKPSQTTLFNTSACMLVFGASLFFTLVSTLIICARKISSLKQQQNLHD